MGSFVIWIVARGLKFRRWTKDKTPISQKIMRQLYASAGLSVLPDQTPLEFISQIEPVSPQAKEFLSILNENYAKQIYFEQPITKEAQHQITRTWFKNRKELCARIRQQVKTG
jgi:hypothetical protein